MTQLKARLTDTNYEIEVGDKAIQLELKDEAYEEFKYLMNRSLNTLDPKKWPEWAKWLDSL